MKNKDIKVAVQDRIEKAEERFKKLQSDFDSKDIHDFRVEMKKIRALLRLAEFAINKKGEMKIPKKLKRFYRTVGNIRSLQLHAKKINETVSREKDLSPDFYLLLLEGRKAVNIRLAKKNRRQIRGIKKEMEKLIKLLPSDIDSLSARRFMEYELSRLKEIQSRKFPSDPELHEARKIMKDILYNWAFIETGLKGIMPASIQKKETMEGFVDRLGHYHDDAVSLDMFKDFPIDQDSDVSEQFELRKIVSKWKEEKAQLHEEIMKGLKKISLNGTRKSGSFAVKSPTSPLRAPKK